MLSDESVNIRDRYCQYRHGAKKRGLEFLISIGDFASMCSLPCDYCGSPPRGMAKSSRSKTPTAYNGIDRVDNAIGYVPGNVVPCCFVCNIAKHTMGVDEFLDWASRLYSHSCRSAAEMTA